MVSGSLALLYFLLGFHGGRQGSGPDRGRSPVEWGDFPYVRPFIRLSVRPPLWAIQPGLRPSQPGLRPSQSCLKPEAWLAGWLGLRSGRTNVWKISPFYRTLSPIGAAAQKPSKGLKIVFCYRQVH